MINIFPIATTVHQEKTQPTLVYVNALSMAICIKFYVNKPKLIRSSSTLIIVFWMIYIIWNMDLKGQHFPGL